MTGLDIVLNVYKEEPNNKIKLINNTSSEIFTGFIVNQNKTDNMLQNIFQQILDSKESDINYLQFYHSLLPYLVNVKTLKSLFEIIFKIYEQSTKNYGNNLHESIVNNNFNLDSICDYSNILHKFTSSIVKKYRLNKYLHNAKVLIASFHKYNFVVNIINKNYQYNNKQYDNLYEFIVDQLDSTKINELNKVIDLYEEYDILSQVMELERKDLKDILQQRNLLTNEIINNYNSILDEKLKDLSKYIEYSDSNTDQVNERTEQYDYVKNIMNIIKYSGNKEFIFEFKNKLRERILESKNMFYEEKIIKYFNTNDFIHDYIQMTYMVNDIKSSLYLKQLFNKVYVICESDKYKNTYVSKNYLKSTCCKTLREFSWKDDINNAGAEYVDAPYVDDGSIISSPHYKHLGDWMGAILKRFND